MWLTSRTIKALLRDRGLRKNLLIDKGLSEEDYLSFDTLDEDRRETISENIINLLKSDALILVFSSPVEQFPDAATVYGTRGAYMVVTQDGTEFFSRKKDAIKYAESINKVLWEIAPQERIV